MAFIGWGLPFDLLFKLRKKRLLLFYRHINSADILPPSSIANMVSLYIPHHALRQHIFLRGIIPFHVKNMFLGQTCHYKLISRKELLNAYLFRRPGVRCLFHVNAVGYLSVNLVHLCFIFHLMLSVVVLVIMPDITLCNLMGCRHYLRETQKRRQIKHHSRQYGYRSCFLY